MFGNQHLAGFNWNYDPATRGAVTSPLTLIPGIPASETGCVDCFVHIDVSLHASAHIQLTDSCFDAGVIGQVCIPYTSITAFELGLYVQGDIAVNGSLGLEDPSMTLDGRVFPGIDLLEPHKVFDLIVPVMGIPVLLASFWINVGAEVELQGECEGRVQLGAAYSSQPYIGAVLNANPAIVQQATDGVQFIRYWPDSPSESVLDMSDAVSCSAELALHVAPGLTLSPFGLGGWQQQRGGGAEEFVPKGFFAKLDFILAASLMWHTDPCPDSSGVQLTFAIDVEASVTSIGWGDLLGVLGLSFLAPSTDVWSGYPFPAWHVLPPVPLVTRCFGDFRTTTPTSSASMTAAYSAPSSGTAPPSPTHTAAPSASPTAVPLTWYYGSGSQSCDAVCFEWGLVCAAGSWPTTVDAMVVAAAAAGVACSTAPGRTLDVRDLPLWSGYASAPNAWGGYCEFNSDAAAAPPCGVTSPPFAADGVGAWQYWSRICPCVAPPRA